MFKEKILFVTEKNSLDKVVKDFFPLIQHRNFLCVWKEQRKVHKFMKNNAHIKFFHCHRDNYIYIYENPNCTSISVLIRWFPFEWTDNNKRHISNRKKCRLSWFCHYFPLIIICSKRFFFERKGLLNVLKIRKWRITRRIKFITISCHVWLDHRLPAWPFNGEIFSSIHTVSWRAGKSITCIRSIRERPQDQ